MICHKGKWIWVGINRTATTSIGAILKKKFTVVGDKHDTALESLAMVGPRKFGKYFKFTIVRNPWARLVSLYLHRKKKNYSQIKKKKITFPQWVKLCFKDKDPDHFLFNGVKFTQTEVDWISDGDKKILVDYIGRYEDLTSTWKHICAKLKIPVIKLPNRNASTPYSYRSFYDKQSKKIVRSFFLEDIKTFGYSF